MVCVAHLVKLLLAFRVVQHKASKIAAAQNRIETSKGESAAQQKKKEKRREEKKQGRRENPLKSFVLMW